jgi:acetyl-CoA carboxylase carboxyl transferase subunit alpha
MSTVLDFEEPIVELERKVQELRDFSSQRDVDMTDGIQELEKRITETRRQIFANLTPWQRVQLARHPQRPHPIEYVEHLFTDFLELKGDRRYSDDRAIFGGFARLGDERVMVIGTRKGRNLKQNVDVNFGSAHPEGYRKALRLMQLADRSGCPIICLIDTPGAYPGIAAEERHIGEAIAVNLLEMFRFSVPVVVVVTGEGGSGGALGIGVGNRVLIMENAYYSVITPEGCAAILWRDGAAAPKAAEALRLTSKDLLEMGIVDAIVPEPVTGAHRDMEGAASSLGEAIASSLTELKSLSPDELRQQRYDKFRALGVYEG